VPIVDDVGRELREALRARDPLRLRALRNIRAAFQNEMKKDGSETLADEAATACLRRLAKQRRESIEAFEAGGRAERAAEERGELAVLESFLPRLAGEERTREWVAEAIAACGASGPGDLGRVMAALMAAHKGEVDGALARRLAAERLRGS
jgi:hypothetical protein